MPHTPVLGLCENSNTVLNSSGVSRQDSFILVCIHLAQELPPGDQSAVASLETEEGGQGTDPQVLDGSLSPVG